MNTRSVVVETVFLQSVVVLVGMGALAFLLWEPHFEGRNAHATPYEVYFNDPLPAYAYVASVSFFAVLFQAFQVLRYARQDRLPSQEGLKALRTIRNCAMAMIGFVIVGEVFILLPNADEPPQAIFMGLLVTFGAAVIAAAASVLERTLRNAIGMLPENRRTA